MKKKNIDSLTIKNKFVSRYSRDLDLTNSEKVTFNLDPKKILWNQDFRGKEIIRKDFSGWVLHGIFDGATFVDCNFQGAAIIYQSEFPGIYSGRKAYFQECNFSNATIQARDGGTFDFDNCTLNNVLRLGSPNECFSMRNRHEERIYASNLEILDLYYKTHNLIHIELEPSAFSNDEEIAYVSLKLDLKGYTALRNKVFKRCVFYQSNFESVCISNQFFECLFSSCLFSGLAKNNYFESCVFSRTTFSTISFENCSFAGSVFHYNTRTSKYSSFGIPNFATETTFSPNSVSQTVDAAPNWKDYSLGVSSSDYLRETRMPDYSEVPLEDQERFNTQDDYVNFFNINQTPSRQSLEVGFKVSREDFLELVRQLEVFEIELTRGGRIFGNYLPKNPTLAWYEALSMSPNDEHIHFTEKITEHFEERSISFLNYINYTGFVCSLDYRAYLEDFYKNISYRDDVEREFFELAASKLGYYKDYDDDDYLIYKKEGTLDVEYDPKDILLIARKAANTGKLLELDMDIPTNLEDQSISALNKYSSELEQYEHLKKLTQTYLYLDSKRGSLESHKNNLDRIYLSKSISSDLDPSDVAQFYIENYPGQFNVVFNGCNLNEVRFSSSFESDEIVKAYFKECELTNLMKGLEVYKPLRFIKRDVNKYESRNFTFENCVFEKCNISALTELFETVGFENCFFGDCNFGDITRIHFDRCGFINCDMNHIKLENVTFNKTWFLFTDFIGSELKATRFSDWSSTAGEYFLDRLHGFTTLDMERLSPDLRTSIVKAEESGIRPLPFDEFIAQHSMWSKFHSRGFIQFFRGLGQPLTKINFEGARFDSRCSIVDSQAYIKMEDYMDLSKAINPPTIRSR